MVTRAIFSRKAESDFLLSWASQVGIREVGVPWHTAFTIVQMSLDFLHRSGMALA